MTATIPANALTLEEYEELERQAEWVRNWNASRPAMALADIPRAKGPAPVLKGARS